MTNDRRAFPQRNHTSLDADGLYERRRKRLELAGSRQVDDGVETQRFNVPSTELR